jgi:hypothetical protein
MPRTPIWLLPALIVVLASGGGWWLWKSNKKPPLPVTEAEKVLPTRFANAMRNKDKQPAQAAPAKPEVAREAAQYSGNGREKLRVTINNRDSKPYPVNLPAGTLFESNRSRVVLLAPASITVPAGANKQEELKSASVSVANEIAEAAFTKSSASNSRLTPLLQLLEKRPEVPFKVAQTAVLALADNAPADVFAKFNRGTKESTVHFDPIAFKVDNAEIIAALALLRESGVADSNLALASDPQVKIESILDSQSHDAALRYYGISPEFHWSFWKYHLLAGTPSMRHYALYGIARYYPEVAMTMMPRWAKEKRLDSIYRVSAIRSLALTQRSDAIPVLQQLQQDLATEPDLAQAADKAAQYLASHQKPQ